MITASRTSALALVVSVLALAACSGQPDSATPGGTPSAAASAPAGAPAAAASAPQAPVTVTTVKAQKRDFPVTLQATGTVTALTSVDVRSQVTSTVRTVHFSEGQFLKAGQLLFTLDTRVDEANLAKARAQLAKDTAALADARRQLARAQQLFKDNFVSQGAVDSAQALVDAATATLAADQAAIDAVRVSLSFGRITAPNAGRAGAVHVAAGSAVQANTTPLVTITQLDPMGVAFSIPQRNLQDALQALQGQGSAVAATLADNGGTFQGRLQFVDNQVDASSGTIKAKAVFANPGFKLWPGAFVDVSQTVAVFKDAVVLPQAAVIQGVRGTSVYVVEDGKAAMRPVKVVVAQGADAVLSGLQSGDVVVLEGKQNLRPNTPVVERVREPQAAQGPRGAASGAPAGAASGTGRAAAP